MDPDLDTVEGALEGPAAGRLSRAVGAARIAVAIVCGLVMATGLALLALGLTAWRSSLPAVVAVLALAVVTIGVAAYVLRRTRALAAALAHPGEVVDQARDLATRAVGSPELHQVAELIRRRDRSPAPRGVGRIRTAVRRGRLISSVIGVATPDPQHHGHLVAFTPERLRKLWLAIIVGFWVWIVAGIVATQAFVALVLRLI